jgi:hypothetical protein
MMRFLKSLDTSSGGGRQIEPNDKPPEWVGWLMETDLQDFRVETESSRLEEYLHANELRGVALIRENPIRA